jgi:hypothetical protein
MPASDPSATRTWTYRFTDPEGAEIATRDLDSDEAAMQAARDLSTSGDVAVVVHRLQRLANSWEYVAEADERPEE